MSGLSGRSGIHIAGSSAIVIIILLAFQVATVAAGEAGDIQISPDGLGYRFEQDGWTYLHTEGSPYERGFQHGYLMAPEIEEIMSSLRYLTYYNTGMEFDFFAESAVEMYLPTIDEEYILEMQGIADGANAAGTNVTFQDILGWNSYKETVGYWWPIVKSGVYAGMEDEMDGCSAFIATGSATEDGDIVIAHTTWTPYERARFFHVISDLNPDTGNSILMQTAPGLIDSSTDFLVTGAGLMITETTISGFNKYETNKTPSFMRLRKAAQYADDLDSFVTIMNTNRSGGFANSWLVGDAKTGEIMRFEQGLKFFNVSKTTDGYFVGANFVEDSRIRNFECSGLDPSEIRGSVGSRMVRFPELMEEYAGEINTENAKTILSDHYDFWQEEEIPSSRTIEGHYELDPIPAYNREPYKPSGSYDGKTANSSMAMNMSFIARWGAPSGIAFDADTYLEEHSQFGYLEGYLDSFPVYSWDVFEAGEKI
ncbi:C45 family autoproteolytic acyltransferase/hydolase [Methanolacinia paynteri]|uniref:C45 family autoproteolytic acyltransferase/hydolase n=1 Tax=Methanolacinia paynteri TaxID=230356 RepID=UPI000694505B|nr:C45 family peptidase [Methanolacinia paynteri]